MSGYIETLFDPERGFDLSVPVDRRADMQEAVLGLKAFSGDGIRTLTSLLALASSDHSEPDPRTIENTAYLISELHALEKAMNSLIENQMAEATKGETS